jgi:eukaryotic-like serine/threonine-protein kinase
LFQQLVAGQLAPAQRAQLADHAAGCRTCNQLVDVLVTQLGRPASSSWKVGAVIGGRFRIDGILGAGGMGVVVAATHLELGSRVAMKFLREELLVHRDLVERFIREARAAAQLRTEHICRVLDVDRLESGAPYILMELLDGVDLARVCAKQPLAVPVAVDYVMQACVALAEAHAAGIVHRDLKPANLFITRRLDGTELVKVLDFGIAKALSDDASLTNTRVAMGSPGYMSPEQLESARDVDARTDLWALGVTLYQLISGRLPFWAPNTTEIAIKVTSEPPAPITLDPGLARVLWRCLEKSPAQRYPDVATLAFELAPFGAARARELAASIARLAESSGARPALGPPARPSPAPRSSAMGGAGVAPGMGAGLPPAGPPGVVAAVQPRDLVEGQRGRRTSAVVLVAVAGVAALGGGVVVATRRDDSSAKPAAGSAPSSAKVEPSSEAGLAPSVSGRPDVASTTGPATSAASAEEQRRQALLDYSTMEDRYLHDPKGQWASSAIASSTYNNADPTTKSGYTPLQATGGPDGVTWSNNNMDMGFDWLELSFATPVAATELRLVLVHGTLGALTKIEAIDIEGTSHLVWKGLDDTKRDDRGPRTWVIKPVPKSSQKTAKVKLTFANAVAPGYREVDAVQLVSE